MKLLCIDYGLSRTGIAVTDTGGTMAFPRCTLHRNPQKPRAVFFDALLTCITEEAPAAIVVGLPLHKDGAESLTTKQVKNFVARLQRRIALPIYLMPEFLSSEEAKSDLHAVGIKSTKHKDILDQQAAVRILESFLAEPDPQQRRL